MRANPFTTASFLSRIFFCWVGELFISGRKRQLESDDLFELDKDDQTQNLAHKLEKEWSNEVLSAAKQGRKPSLGRAMVTVFGRFYLLLGVSQCAEELIKITQPLMIAGMLSAIARRTTDPGAYTEAVAYAVAVSLCSVTIAVIHHPLFFQMLRIGMWLRVSMCSLLYRKVLRLNQQSMLQVSTGKIVNMMTNDVQRMDHACAFLHFLWIGPLQTVLVLAILWYQIGVAAVAGVAALVLMSPIQFWIARLFARIRSKTAVLTDERVKLTSEMIHGMRVVKMYCWEQMFVKLISKVRRKELDRVVQAAMINMVKLVQYMVHTKAAMFVFLGTAVMLAAREGRESGVTVADLFLVMCLFNAIRLVLTIFIPLAAQFGSEGAISIQRFQKVLLLDELESADRDVSEEKVRVSMEKFTASWDDTSEASTLSNISFSAHKSELIGVVGPVGAGKSSLLLALLGELPASSGSLEVSGSVAYIAQQPWVFAATVRQNVVFGRKWNKELYEASIRAAALDKDLKLLPQGDHTIVGERGVSLSGGQKARVALARGLYSDASIYLLDDPLSAVDTAVAKHLFRRCIRDHLKGRIRVLVTHQLQFLKEMDRIIVLRGGEVLNFGTYQDLVCSGLDLENLLTEAEKPESPMSKCGRDSMECLSSSQHISRANSLSLEAISQLSLPDLPDGDAGAKEGDMKFEQQEERAIGSIGWRVYYKYFTAGANCFLLFGLFVLFGLAQVAYVMCDWWLTVWMKWERIQAAANLTDFTNFTYLAEEFPPPYSSFNASDPYAEAGIGFVRGFQRSTSFLFVFGMITLSVFVCTLLRSIGFVGFTVSASYTLHQRMLKRIVHARTQFFDTNSVGRILNRFSKDIGVMDEMLPPCLSDFFICSCLVVGNLSVNFVIAPWTIIGILPLVFLFVLLRQYYMQTSRSVKRLEAIARSPVFSHLNNTLLGLATVRSSGSEQLFSEHYFALQDEHSRSWFAFLVTSRWFGIRLDWLCVTFVMVSCTACVTVRGLDDTQVGLMLTYAVGLLGMFQWCVRQSTEVENNMVSIERVVDYTQLPQESAFWTPHDKQLPDAWPAVGAVEFRDVNFAYDAYGPRVLQDVSFRVLPREKVGIVGRTGAGKSSLIYCLFRLAEVDTGAILIDAQPTGPPMGLHTLRKQISIIPQDPVLFTGTVRWNLDPTGRRDDEALWRALDDVQLREAISAMPAGLDAKVAESGVNLSVGQRQLMCLARALLGDNRLLVIDEATANVDPATDALIQQTIRSKFCNCTVLTIAHRLHTIMDSDRVMVMDAGRLVEFDHPKVLIDRPESHFARMLLQLDSAHVRTLHGIARAAFKRRESSDGSSAENGAEVLPASPERLVNKELVRVCASSRLGHSSHSLNSIFEADEDDSAEREPLV